MKNLVWILLFAGVSLMISCDQAEGPGGQSVITGRVQVIDYNMELTNYLGTYYAYDEDVYLIYGNDSIPSDDVETSYNGYYRFEYLQPGHYSVYAISEDTTGESASDHFAVIKEVLIPENGDEVEVEVIVIVK
ncbi:MAG: hypothetical protein U9N51_03995 [Bacteroidota bacterium]|nr:hypothetical protein [Bacteroidota bacterium]